MDVTTLPQNRANTGSTPECARCDRQMRTRDAAELWSWGWRHGEQGWVCAICVAEQEAKWT